MAKPSDSEIVANLAEDFIELHRQGKRPRIDDYVQNHPHLAEEIRDLFPTLLVVEDLAPDQDASIDGDIAFVGAYGDDTFTTDGGGVYVFEEAGGAWTEVAHLGVCAIDGEDGLHSGARWCFGSQ